MKAEVKKVTCREEYFIVKVTLPKSEFDEDRFYTNTVTLKLTSAHYDSLKDPEAFFSRIAKAINESKE